MSRKSSSTSSSDDEASLSHRLRSTPLISPEPTSLESLANNPEEEEVVSGPSSEIVAPRELVPEKPVVPGSSTESATAASKDPETNDFERLGIGYSSRYFWFLYNQKIHAMNRSMNERLRMTYGYANGYGDSDGSVDLKNENLYMPAEENSSTSELDSDDDLSEKEKSDASTEKPSNGTRREQSTSEDTSESESRDTS